MTAIAEDLQIVEQAQRMTARLAVEVEQLRRELRRARNNGRPGRHERILHRAHADARTILMLRQAGYSVSRRWLDEAGLVSAWRFGWALALLRYARTDTTPANLVHLETCIRRLDTARDRLLSQSPRDAMITLRGLAGKRYLHDTSLFRGSGVGKRRGRPV